MVETPTLNGSIFILGGARSGKSAFAESLFASADQALYLATAETLDDEMYERVQRHRERRGSQWVTVEEPLAIGDILRFHQSKSLPILVDCLTIWLSNLMQTESDIDGEIDSLTDIISAMKQPLVLVSNEVGSGIVPDNKLARDFRDQAGKLNQRIAATVNRVYLITAGLPQQLK